MATTMDSNQPSHHPSQPAPYSNQPPLVKMTRLVETVPGTDVTDQQMNDAAALFRDNYGVWGPQSPKAGQPVTLAPNRLRQQYLPDDATTFYTSVLVDGVLAGNAFTCRWQHDGKQICWVTQLVVSRNHRRSGLATTILLAIKHDGDDVYGIMSSHPAACLAAAHVFAGHIEKLRLDYVAENAKQIMQASPIPYIRDANPHGTLFNDDSVMVSGVDSGFFVDHTEPNQALNDVRRTWDWPLGDLSEGHEFLMVVQTRRRSSRRLQRA